MLPLLLFFFMEEGLRCCKKSIKLFRISWWQTFFGAACIYFENQLADVELVYYNAVMQLVIINVFYVMLHNRCLLIYILVMPNSRSAAKKSSAAAPDDNRKVSNNDLLRWQTIN